jgi:YD repeat-containing protein
VTFTDEGSLINFAGAIKKRQQKIYSDVFGRPWKTEVLNWDGSGPNGTAPNNSVYSTTINTYNVRDQLTNVKMYQGTESSGAFQETTLTYDGYGRLKTRHTPIQNAGATTTWNYKPMTPFKVLAMLAEPRPLSAITTATSSLA